MGVLRVAYTTEIMARIIARREPRATNAIEVPVRIIVNEETKGYDHHRGPGNDNR